MTYILLDNVEKALESVTDCDRKPQSNPVPDPIVFDNDEQVLESVDEIPNPEPRMLSHVLVDDVEAALLTTLPPPRPINNEYL